MDRNEALQVIADKTQYLPAKEKYEVQAALDVLKAQKGKWKTVRIVGERSSTLAIKCTNCKQVFHAGALDFFRFCPVCGNEKEVQDNGRLV